MKKMNQLIKYTISAVALCTIALTTAYGQKIMTLEECRQQAVEYNKELKNAALQNKEAKANQDVARTAYLPTVSGSLSLMHRPGLDGINVPGYFLPTADSEADALEGNYSGTSNVWNPGISLPLENLTLINGGLTIAQPIYSGGKIKYSNKQADAGVDISGMALNLKYSELIENTDKAFWQLATVESNIKIASEYIKMLTELEEQMTAMFEVGLQPASEKLKVSVQKNEAELNLLKAKNGLKISKMYLNQLLGQDLQTDIQISHNAEEDVQLLNLDEVAKHAENQRNELKILQKQKEISEYDAKIARSDYLPSVGISAQYTNYWVNDLYEEVDFQPMLAAQVTIPIFQWGQGKKKQRAAQLRIEQAQTQLQNTTDLINLEVMQVKVQLEEAYESIGIAQKNIAESKESLEETKASFDVGLNTTTEMLNAQAKWQEAESQLVQAIAEFKILETRWERVTGSLYMPE